jgi:ATP adenylyltransferase
MFSSHIYSDRLEYVRKKPSKECFFCRVSKERDGGKSGKLYHKNGVMVVINDFPYTTGHVMVVPERHVVMMEDLTEKEYLEMWMVVRKTVKLLRKTYNPPALNVGVNVGGKISGGSLEHLHIHVVPRYETDNSMMEAIFDTKVMPEPLGKTYKTLKKSASLLG